MRVVLDTNIVLSALLFRKGHLAWLRTAWVNYCLKHATYCQPVNESIRASAYEKGVMKERRESRERSQKERL